MANPSGVVKFVYVPTGQSMPDPPDNNTVYYLEEAKQIYVGSHPIANWTEPATNTTSNSPTTPQ